MWKNLTEQEIEENTLFGVAQAEKWNREESERIAGIAKRIAEEFPDPKRQTRVMAMSSAAFYRHDEDDPNLSRISAQRIKDHDNVRTQVENYCENFYDKQYGINQAHMGYGILLRLRQIAADAMAEYDKAFMLGPAPDCIPPYGVTCDPCEDSHGFTLDWDWNPASEIVPIALAAHIPGYRWPIRGKQTFGSVARHLKDDFACELELRPNCYRSAERAYENDPKQELSVLLKPPVFPLPYGDFVVFAKICWNCWKLYKQRYSIGECRIESPFDGLG